MLMSENAGGCQKELHFVAKLDNLEKFRGDEIRQQVKDIHFLFRFLRVHNDDVSNSSWH